MSAIPLIFKVNFFINLIYLIFKKKKRNLIAIAPTGSGKTLAYALP